MTLTADELFIASAVRRMYRWMALFVAAGAAVLLAWKGAWYAGGFAVGGALSVLNFHWLKSAVDALGSDARGRGVVVAKFLLRYALIVAAGFVIFQSSALSLSAFLGGLFVFVAGVLAEMIYELAAGTGPES